MKRRKPTLVDVIRLGSIIWPIAQVMLEAGPATKATLEVPLERRGRGRWNWRLNGAPTLIVDGTQD